MMWPLRRRPAVDPRQAMILVQAEHVANQLVLVTDEMKDLVSGLRANPRNPDDRRP